MNKRIQQLAEQAGLNYHNWITKESNVNNGDFKYPRLEDYENFAELIVKECISIVDDAERGGSNDVWDNAVKFIKRDLQEHFGVEE